MTAAKGRAALGFRVHSGWAAMVVVAGPPRSPAVIDRCRIELIKSGIPRQPYHAAEGMELKAAEKLISRCTDTARLLAREAVGAAMRDLRNRGYEVVGSGLLLASGRPLPGLAATLASHALIHTAEGELFRDALLHASQHYRLPVACVKEREIFAQGAAQLGVRMENLPARLNDLGRSLGPPWRQDEKLAALVAWLAVASPPKRHGRTR
jgi:hypothetical protein